MNENDTPLADIPVEMLKTANAATRRLTDIVDLLDVLVQATNRMTTAIEDLTEAYRDGE